MDTYISQSPEETLALGEAWGREAEPGLVVALSGDLGAGKTQLVKGLARGLGITTRVHSPTFSLLNEYPGGRLPLHHLDLYRLASPAAILGAGLEEFLAGTPGVVVVEWAERWYDLLGPDRGQSCPPIALESPTPMASFPAIPRASPQFRRVVMEVLSDTQRQIRFEDTSVPAARSSRENAR